jgi:hypothetical protein
MKRIFSLLTFSVFSIYSFSQLNNVSVNAYFSNVNVQVEGIDSVNLKIIDTETTLNDLDFFGEILIEFKEVSSDYIVYIVKKTKAEILQEGLLSNGIIRIPGYHIENDRSYKIRFVVRDYQGIDALESEFLLTH